MKKILFIVVLLSSCMSGYSQKGYYLSSGFVELSSDESVNYKYVQAIDIESKKVLDSLYNSLSKAKLPYIKKIVDDRYLVDKNFVLPKVDFYESPIYRGGILAILPRIIISLEEGYKIEDILGHFGNKVLVARSENDYRGGKRFYIDCQMRTSDEILETIKSISSLAESKGIRYLEPEAYMRITYCNTYYSQQYYLHNTEPNSIDINAEPAWGITTGSPSITVAVVDCGVEINHADLSGRVLNGYTIGFPTSYGEPVNDVYSKKYHGTAVAGIIAANNNSIGIRGVAWGVKVLPVNIVPGDYDMFGTNQQIADAIRWAYPYADVINCSWGGAADSDEVHSAIDEAMYNGRNGKGCVVVAAAGNNGNSNNVAYPARYNGVIAVGAIHQNGLIWDYSQTGSSMCLVAPSGGGDVVTTDRSAPKGKNAYSDYIFTFGGTSAAAPQVAGVAALMLSVNPNLLRTQVKANLESTATDLGINGFDTTYGYGVVNAYQAVLSVLPENFGYSLSRDTRSDNKLGYWVKGSFNEFAPDDAFSYRLVKSLDAESQKILNDLYDSGNESLLKIVEDCFFVPSDYRLPTGKFFESPIYSSSMTGHVCVFPRIVVSMNDDSQVESILEQFGSKLTVERNEPSPLGGERYILNCQTDKSEEVLKIAETISSFEGNNINYVEPEMLMLDLELLSTLTGINDAETNSLMESSDYYSLGGLRLKSPAKGINIIRQSDGTAKKVFVK